MVNEALDEKLRDAGTLFEAQILLRCRAAERARAKSAMQLLLGAFEPLTAQNWLRARGLALGGFAFLGSDLPLAARALRPPLRDRPLPPARAGGPHRAARWPAS